MKECIRILSLIFYKLLFFKRETYLENYFNAKFTYDIIIVLILYVYKKYFSDETDELFLTNCYN